MGWEERRGRFYYYSSERIGGRVKKTYWGNGPLARMLAETDASLAYSDRMHRHNERAFAENMELHDPNVEEFCQITDLLMKASLMEAGYHQHKRGEWRKRRARKGIRKKEEG